MVCEVKLVLVRWIFFGTDVRDLKGLFFFRFFFSKVGHLDWGGGLGTTNVFFSLG